MVELLAGARTVYPSQAGERPELALPGCQRGTVQACHLEVPTSFYWGVNTRSDLDLELKTYRIR